MKIRMKRTFLSTFHGNPKGVRIGDVVDVDDDNGARYCRLGYAEPVTKTAQETVKRDERKVEKAALQENVETATLGVPPENPEHQVAAAAADPKSVQGPVDVHPTAAPKPQPVNTGTKRTPSK